MAEFPIYERNLNLLEYGRDQMLFVFDDIVFHIVSLLDYAGNLIGSFLFE
jgi:hypothetical protein